MLHLIYKCQRCGETHSIPYHGEAESIHQALMVTYSQEPANTHECINGDLSVLGLSLLIGGFCV